MMAPSFLFTSVVLVLFCLLPHSAISTPPIISGEPAPLINNDVTSNSTIASSLPSNSSDNADQGAKVRRITKNNYLRILPLGASITQGVDSSTGNGYRKPLRDKLRSQGWLVNMVGSKRDGSMVDNVSSTSTLDSI